jgi:AraC family transcriptional regulator
LIRSADVPLVDIALDAGFASQSHLTRLFREVVGVTPGEIRKQMVGKKLQ